MQNNTFSGLFVGQNLITLNEVDSTNTFLKDALSKSTPLLDGTVIMAEKQFAGRGQVENSWQSEAGKNLTFSILLNPSFLAVDRQFELNKAISIALNDVLIKYIPASAFIKWPNDLYINDKKLGGILIEGGQKIIGEPFWMIIGIGLNLKSLTSTSNSSQIEYPIACLADLPGLGQSQLIPIWHQLTQSLSDVLNRYMNSGFEQFIPDWNQWHLFQDQLVEIHDENTAVLTGKCRGINNYGAIIIETTGGIKTIHNGTLSLKKP